MEGTNCDVDVSAAADVEDINQGEEENEDE
jgi:hypothetical protein